MSRSLVRSGRARTQRSTTGASIRVPAETRVFGPTCQSRRVYLLNSGWIQLSADHGPVTDYPAPGDFFGEKAVFAGTKDRQQIARTLTPARLTVFRPRELLDRLQQDRRFAIKFVRGLARRLDRLEEVISDFIAENAERRLVRVLLRLAPPVASSWVRLPFALTNVDFARTIGTTRARISQFLTRFQRLGWLRRHHQHLWIKREAFDQFLHSRTKPEADRQASHG